MKIGDLDIDWRWVVAIVAVGASWIAYAEATHQRTHTNSELVNILGERHLEEDAKEEGKKEGERELLKKLCDARKLDPDGEECAALRE